MLTKLSKLAVPNALLHDDSDPCGALHITFTKLESSGLELHCECNLETADTVRADVAYHFFHRELSSDGNSYPTHVELGVNGEKKESAYQYRNLNCSFDFQSVVLFTLLFPLKKEGEV